MIFSVYLSAMGENRRKSFNDKTTVNDYALFKELLDKTNHLFICIIPEDAIQLKELFHKYEFQKYVIWKNNRPITNPVHQLLGPRLIVYALRGKGKSNEF